MLKFIMQRVPFTCIVRNHKQLNINNLSLLVKSISTTPVGWRRYDASDSVRQVVTESDVVSKDNNLSTILTAGSRSIFPTVETHSQMFNGVRFTDLPIVHVKATSNNTIISLTSGDGTVLAIESAGTIGYRNAKKGTNVAAQATAISLAGNALKKKVTTVRVCLRGIGPGRLPALKALQLAGLNIVSITDTTRLAFNGNRPKKARRI